MKPTRVATPTSNVGLADWVEKQALVSPKKSASQADLERFLVSSSAYGSSRDVESKVVDVFSELDRRLASAGVSYPFDLALPSLQLRRNAWRDCSAYLFCLAISLYGNGSSSSIFPDRIFEQLATEAARAFIGGDAIRIGSPRDHPTVQRSFAKAVDQVCLMLQEGEGFSGRPVHWSKDEGVDIVAWRHQADMLPGKLLLFGGCATGSNWRIKVHEVAPLSWAKKWVKGGGPYSPVIRAFFIPFRIEPLSRWTDDTIDAGIVFDRCRIARWARRLPTSSLYGDGMAWSLQLLTKAA